LRDHLHALSPLFQMKFQSPTGSPPYVAAIGRAGDDQHLRFAGPPQAIPVRLLKIREWGSDVKQTVCFDAETLGLEEVARNRLFARFAAQANTLIRIFGSAHYRPQMVASKQGAAPNAGPIRGAGLRSDRGF
jgi:hypothetical protein